MATFIIELFLHLDIYIEKKNNRGKDVHKPRCKV